MRGVLVTVVVAGALAVAAVALAAGSNRSYAGNDKDSLCGSDPALPCTVTFTGVVRHDKVKKVTKFDFQGVPLSCDEGLVAENPAHAAPAMGVGHDRRFSLTRTNPDTGVHLRIKGRLSRSFAKAKGIFRVRGPVFGTSAGDFHNCDTGVDHYKVTEVTH